MGGFAIGIAQKDMTVSEALQRFTLLSIGDGLVSQIPALIVSTAAGILVTRAASKDDLGQELGRQLFSYPRAMMVLAGMMAVPRPRPRPPQTPFLILGLLCAFVAYTLHTHGLPDLAACSAAPTGTSGATRATTAARRRQRFHPSAPRPAAGSTPNPANLSKTSSPSTPSRSSSATASSARRQTQGRGDLLDRVTGVRRTFAQEIGVIIPPIRLRDNLQLGPNEYRFLLKGHPIAQGQLMPGYWLAMNATNSPVTLKGVPTVEPVFGLPATWITDAERKTAELSGHTLVDAASVLVTHLSELLKRHCHALLSRQDVQNLLDHLRQTHPAVVNELVPAQLSVGQIQRVLQNLLAEGVSIHNLAGILEKISDFAAFTKNPDELSEHARRALAPQIAKPFRWPTTASLPSPSTRASNNSSPRTSAKPPPTLASPSSPASPATSSNGSPAPSSR
ncbi:MAG: flagellar biosynthesis protein FlhA [Verrucomicrobia bacterium]|nr:flagellar biosynthesis protein FlhA [Verrucomicrobiota bacterium]